MDFSNVKKVFLPSRLPFGYQEVEYIESTGVGQYIDTGVVIYDYCLKLKMTVDMQLGSQNQNYPMQGVGNFGGNFGYYWSIPTTTSTSNEVSLCFGDSGTSSRMAVFPNAKDTNRHTLMIDAYHGEMSFDSTVVTDKTAESVSSGLGNGHINLFSIRNNNSASNGAIVMKLYGCIMSDESTDTMLRNFIPCYRVSDNEIGLYDTVNDVFYTNQGSGKFNKGKNISGEVIKITTQSGVVLWESTDSSPYQEVEYIESTGTQRIDTGYVVTNLTRIVADMQEITANTYPRIFANGSLTGVGNVVMEYELGTLFVKLGSNSSYTRTDITRDLARHTYEINKNIARYDGTQIDSSNVAGFTGGALCIFAHSTSTSPDYFKGRLYAFKIYENDELVRDFVPCYRKSDNEIGLYDPINDVFYSNAGTGIFTKGPDVT